MVPSSVTCTACPLHASAITNCIPGRGPEHASVMIVAQGPGGNEDMAGSVLIGRSGQILEKMLRNAGYDPTEVFLTNATRCRAPQDRAPTPSEIDACREHLKREIHSVRPQVLVALGDAALRSLCKASGVSSKRGKSYALHSDFEYEAEVWPTYHPAYVLRVPTAESTVTADLRRVRDRATPQSSVPWQWWNGKPLVALRDLFPGRNEVLGLDIETLKYVGEDGKTAYTEDPRQIALANEDIAAVTIDEMHGLLRSFSWEHYDVVTHNGWAFDVPKIREHVEPNWPWGYDTQVLAYLEDENQPLGLESLCVKYLGVRGWKEEKDAPLGSDQFAEYNARDAWYTRQLYLALRDRLGESRRGVPRIRIATELILPAKLALDSCTERGIYIDGEAVASVERELTAKKEQLLAELQHDAATAGFVRTRGKKKIVNVPYNPNSADDLTDVLRLLGIVITETTETGKAKTDKATLQQYTDVPFVAKTLEYKSVTKTLSTYVEPYKRAAASDDGRIHSQYHVYKREVGAGGTITGRTSCSNPDSGKWKGRGTNDQNLDRKYKHFFTAPPDGSVLVSVDYSGIEFRLGAMLANERTILDRYAQDPNWDPHRFFAAMFFKKPESEITKHERNDIAKSANFSQEYMGMPWTLQEYAKARGVELSYALCEELHQAWHHTFPGFITGLYIPTRDELEEYGYVESLVGYRRHIGDWKLLGNKSARFAALRECVNFKVQNLAWCIAAMALRSCHEHGLPMNAFVHDDIKFEFPSMEAYEEKKSLIDFCMIDEPLRLLRELFNCTITVPIVNEHTVTQHTKRAA